jgi:hypothetical protein
MLHGHAASARRVNSERTIMRGALCLLCAASLLLGGCGRALRSVADVAENARTATEQMVSTSSETNAQREIALDPDAADMRTTPELKLSQRFEMRAGPDGFMVYDTENHTIARIGNQSQAGLSLDQAKKSTEALAWAADHNETAGEQKGPPEGAPP